MRPLSLAQVADWCDARLLGDDANVAAIDIDSRTVRPGSLFVALVGERHDGHDHSADALARGAVALLVSRPLELDAPQVVCANTEVALGRIAAGMAATRATRIIAITGSNGKTTVKTLVHAILAHGNASGRVYANPGNRNNQIGLPLALIEQPEDTAIGIYEMGAGQPGDIAYLTDIARPDIALVNNVAPAHLERMGSLLGVAETKGAIYGALRAGGTAVVNADDAFATWFEDWIGDARTLRFGLEASADVFAAAPTAAASSWPPRWAAPRSTFRCPDATT
jgi:UDP-N-acetylmuramoyl-tripeptide--D-alanyl-D-alanine ligase